MVYFQKMTPAGYAEIEREIAALKQQRPGKIKNLQHAKSMGDLSENAEYTTAKQELGHLQSRLRYLEKQLRYAQVIEKSTDGKAGLGSKVVVEFAEDDQATYTIVGALEQDLSIGKLSFDSPLGQALLGHKAGESMSVDAPFGSYQVKLISVN